MRPQRNPLTTANKKRNSSPLASAQGLYLCEAKMLRDGEMWPARRPWANKRLLRSDASNRFIPKTELLALSTNRVSRNNRPVDIGHNNCAKTKLPTALLCTSAYKRLSLLKGLTAAQIYRRAKASKSTAELLNSRVSEDTCQSLHPKSLFQDCHLNTQSARQ